MDYKEVLYRFKYAFINLWLLVFIAITGLVIFPLIFFSKINLDYALFVTEWEKIWWEAILITIIFQALTIIRDSYNEKRIDRNFIENNLLIFIEKSLEKLQYLEKNFSVDNCKISGKAICLCWAQVANFLEENKYFVMIDKKTSFKFFDLHNELQEEKKLDLLTGYINNYSSFDIKKVRFTIKIMTDIKSNIQKILKDANSDN